MSEITTGPRTTEKDFFTKHLNTEIKELNEIRNCAENGDIKKTENLFARFIKNTLDPEKVLKDWHISNLSIQEKEIIIRDGKSAMDYIFAPCGIPYQFKDHKIDWIFNPTYNQYVEWQYQVSRHKEFTDLAKYYLLTGDEKAAETYVDMINSWFRQAIVPENIPGVNTLYWRTLEAAIRVDVWYEQIHAFIHSPALDDAFITRFFISLYEHGWRIRNFGTSGNWLIKELYAMVILAVGFPFYRDANNWHSYALRRLEEEFDNQIYPDGFQYELTPGYHGLVVDTYYHVEEFYIKNNLPVPEFFRTKYEKVFRVYTHLTRPDRCCPQLNDSGEPTIMPYVKLAARLFPEKGEYRWFATDGAEGTEPEFLSYVFPYSGCAVMRSGWERDAVWGYMDCSPFGHGHHHEDKLNVLIFAYGKKLLTETGIYDYDTSEMRRYVLDTRSHNTIRIDGMNQNISGTYKWEPHAINEKADCIFELKPERDVVESKYEKGYGPENIPVIHKRRFIFFKNVPGMSPFFAVIDRILPQDYESHTYEITWHYETCSFTTEENYVNGDYGDGIGLTIVFSDKTAALKNMIGQYEPYYQGWMPIMPSGPHEHRPTPTPVWTGNFSGGKRLVSILYPYKDDKNIIKNVIASDLVEDTKFTVILSNGNKIELSES